MKKADNFEGQKMFVLPKEVINALSKSDIAGDLYVTDIGIFLNAANHYRYRNNGSTENILIICTDGKGHIETMGKCITIEKNQFAIIPKNQAHRYYSDFKKPWSIYWLHFKGRKDNHFVNDIEKLQESRQVNLFDIDERLQLFERILLTLEEDLSAKSIEYCSIILMHLLASFKYLYELRRVKTLQQGDNLSNAIRFMKDNLHRKIKLKEVAEVGNLSVSQVSLQIKKRTSQSPLEYFNFLKTQKACSLLTFSELKIKDIAQQLGFDDPYYFSRVFTKVMGMSPVAYRKNEREA